MHYTTGLIFPPVATACFARTIPKQAAPLYPRAATTTTAAVWPFQTFHTEPFEPPILGINRTGVTAEGYLFFTPGPAGSGTTVDAPLVMTDTSELIWQGNISSTETATNLRTQNYNNASYLTYWAGPSLATYGRGYGAVHFLDHSYVEQYSVCLPNMDFVTVNNTVYECYCDMHESQVTDRGTIIVTAYNITRHDLKPVGGRSDGWILDSQFYEIDIATNEIVFSWKSLDHTDQLPITQSQYPLTLDGIPLGVVQNYAWDYFHTNAISVLEDGYLLSSRHFWKAIKISKTGSIEWSLQGGNNHSDFALDPAAHFSWQHDLRAVNVTSESLTLHMHNNDNSEVSNGTSPTTGLAIDVCLTDKTAKLSQRFIDPSDIIYSDSEGSYQPLSNGNVLLGHGQVAKIKEYNSGGEIAYTAQFAPVNDGGSYRAFRLDWQATPAAAPKIAVETASNGTYVYMSWDGATDYNGWTIYGGNSTGNLTLIGHTPKIGFETSFLLNDSEGYVQVQAMSGTTGLAKSVVYVS